MRLENSKDYYNVAGVEAIQVITKTRMSFCEGNAFKYLYRCNNINPKGSKVEDLKKARYYIQYILNDPIRSLHDYNGERYIGMINQEIYDTDIYEAMCEIIIAVSVPGSDYVNSFTNALEYLNNAINRNTLSNI